jgi:AcrR family transcriptional regulator
VGAPRRTRRHRRASSSLETRAERKRRTREALLDAALRLLDGRAFASLSLREVAREAGIVPGGFYRHFQDMDELGLALVDGSFGHLRQMLRKVRRDPRDLDDAIDASVTIMARYVRENRLQFRFIARERNSGLPALRRAIRSEIRLFSGELATDLARCRHLSSWSSDDVRMLAALMVSTLVAAVEEILDAPPDDPLAEREVVHTVERQLRLIVLAVPHWQSVAGVPGEAGEQAPDAAAR